MQKLVFILLGSIVATVGLAQTGFAFPQFQKEFVAMYVKEKAAPGKVGAGGEKEPSFEELATGAKTKCYVCHQGKKRKDRNPYGLELSNFLTKKDKKDTEKIVKALKDVAKMHVNAKDKKSPTYGELIEAGKLPGGTLEECMKDPKERWPPDGKPVADAASTGAAKKAASGKKP